MKQITEFTVTELKALIYDQLQSIELAQQNMKALGAELQKRSQPQDNQAPESKLKATSKIVDPKPVESEVRAAVN